MGQMHASDYTDDFLYGTVAEVSGMLNTHLVNK